MFSYFIMFFCSYIFMSVYVFLQKKYKIFSWIFLIIAILIPSIFAGIRSLYVGIDIGVYGNRIFETSLMHGSFQSMWRSNPYFQSHFELGYVYFNYIVSRFTHNIHLYYFVLNLVTCVITFLGINNFKKQSSISLAWLLFLFVLWPFSLNILRQSISMAFGLLSFSQFCKKKYEFSILNFVLAYLMHESSIVLIAIYFTVIYFNKFKGKFSSKALPVIGLPLIIIGVISIVMIVAQFIPKYARHFSKMTESSFSIEFFILFIMFLSPYIIDLVFRRSQLNTDTIKLFSFLIYFGAILSGLGGMNYVFFGRASYYFIISIIIGVPIINRTVAKSSGEESFYNLLSIVISILFFYFIFYIGNYGNIFPYSSIIF